MFLLIFSLIWFDLGFTARQDYFTHFEPVSHVTRARLEPRAARASDLER